MLAFAGYFIASRNSDELVAQHELTALMFYTPSLEYMKRKVDKKEILYVG